MVHWRQPLPLLWLAASFLLLAFLAPPARAAGRSATVRVLMVVLDRTSLADWEEPGLPVLHELLRRGAVGLMNTNTASGDAEGAAALTIAASAHLYGPPVLPFRLRSVAGSVRLQAADLATLQRDNRRLPYPYRLGALANTLAAHHLSVAFAGDADLPPPLPPDRSFAGIVMNGQGLVPTAVVGGSLDHRARGPLPLVVDNHQLLAATLRLLRRHSLTVVFYGDTERANRLWPTASPSLRRRLTHLALRHADAFLGLLLPRLPRPTWCIIVSPLPSWPMVRQNATLTPVLLYGPGIPAGLLTSSTTHRQGIVTNVDLAPTILHLLGLPTWPYAFGQPMYAIPRSDAPSLLTRLASSIAFVSRLRQPLLHVVVFFIVLVYALALFVWLRKVPLGKFARRLLLLSLRTVLYLPFSLLVFPLFGVHDEGAAFLVVAGAALLPATLTELWLRDPRDRLYGPALLVTLVLLVDLFTGQHLVRSSPLGYDPQIGARYYGIGNEFMGVLIGASTLGFPALLDRLGRRALPLLVTAFAVTVVALVTPGLGTKVGGAVTATVAYGVVLYRLSGRRIGSREFLTIASVVVVLIAGMIAFDLLVHGSRSRTDVGRTWLLVHYGGLSQLGIIIIRKLSTDIALIQGSYWSILLGVALAAAVGYFLRQGGVTRTLSERLPYTGIGILGALAGAGAALLFNDTGVVAASTDIIFPVSALLLFVLGTPEGEGDPSAGHTRRG